MINNEKDFREVLKDVTKVYHDRIESTPLAVSLASGNVYLQKYVDYLWHLYKLHLDLENKAKSFSEWEKWGIVIKDRQRAHLLKKDIDSLDLVPNQYQSYQDFSKNWSFANIVGAMYVLEGSTMGGQILSQRLENIKSKNGQGATNYFKAYEKETMTMWMKYVEFLNEFSNKNNSLKDEIIEGAEQTYGAIERIMLEVGD